MPRQVRPHKIGQRLVVAIDHAQVEEACFLVDLFARGVYATFKGGSVDGKGKSRQAENRCISGCPGRSLRDVMRERLAKELEELVHAETIWDVRRALRHDSITDGAWRGKGVDAGNTQPGRLGRHLTDAVDIAVRRYTDKGTVVRAPVVGVIIVAIIVVAVRNSRG